MGTVSTGQFAWRTIRSVVLPSRTRLAPVYPCVATTIKSVARSGAAVAINGKPSGKTPLTINDLAPREYNVTMTLSGYRSFATTVRVVAGERVRAAASLTAQEQE